MLGFVSAVAVTTILAVVSGLTLSSGDRPLADKPFMSLKLYDLAGAESERRFSPYCWRAKLALAHKGLATETIPWRFTDKDVIAFSEQGRVPVLVDGDRVVSDSWAIAIYLEETYSDRPSPFGGPDAPDDPVAAWRDRLLGAFSGLARNAPGYPP
jgi:hypothetical protein